MTYTVEELALKWGVTHDEACRRLAIAIERGKREQQTMIGQHFWDAVYTLRQVSELLYCEESWVWQLVSMYAIPAGYRHGDTILWLRPRIHEWLEAGQPEIGKYGADRREINRLLGAALGCAPPQETIPSELPVVGMGNRGETITFDQED